MRVRISTENDFISPLEFDDLAGVTFMRMLGKAYEGYLARGDSAKTIKSLAVLASSENTGHVFLSPKLVAFALRVVSEQLTVKCLQMNAINDRVVLKRYGTAGITKTNELLDASTPHRDVQALSLLLNFLSHASQKFIGVYFLRFDENEPAESEEVEAESADVEGEEMSLEIPSAPTTGEESELDEHATDPSVEKFFEKEEIAVTTGRKFTAQASAEMAKKLVERALRVELNERSYTFGDLLTDSEQQDWENPFDRTSLGMAFSKEVAVRDRTRNWQGVRIEYEFGTSPKRYKTVSALSSVKTTV